MSALIPKVPVISWASQPTDDARTLHLPASVTRTFYHYIDSLTERASADPKTNIGMKSESLATAQTQNGGLDSLNARPQLLESSRSAVTRGVGSYFAGGLAKIIPFIGVAALLYHAGYLLDQRDTRTLDEPKLLWLDKTTDWTWNSADVSSGASLSPTSTGLPSAIRERIGASVNGQIDLSTEDQPRYDYATTVAYAEEMGLPTNFPL